MLFASRVPALLLVVGQRSGDCDDCPPITFRRHVPDPDLPTVGEGEGGPSDGLDLGASGVLDVRKDAGGEVR